MIHRTAATRFGTYVVAGLSAGLDASHLLPAELPLVKTMGPRRVATFAGGRLALRAALGELGIAAAAIPSTPRGAPVLPEGVVGSLSHKDEVAVAIAARRVGREHLGIDVELDAPLRVDISKRICRAEELTVLASLAAEERDRRVRVTFAVKEAIYKAIDPYVQRYVAFDEVALRFDAGGRVEADLHLDPPDSSASPPWDFELELAWEPLDGPQGERMILAFARAIPRL